jgi:hypothetical protein
VSTGDQFRASVVCHVHFDGANNATGITDTTGQHTFSANGNAKLSTARPAFGTAAGEFDGSGDSWESTDNPNDFKFTTGDFTVEGKFQADTLATFRALVSSGLGTTSNSAQDWRVSTGTIGADGVLSASAFVGTTGYNVSTTGVIAGTTHSFCLERYNGYLYLYLDGVVCASPTFIDTNSINQHNGWFRIGAAINQGDFDGMIDELRVTKGIARYKGTSYTPDATAFPEVGLVATGFSAITFGTPVCPTLVKGFSAITFGTPTTPIHPVTGFSAIHFGTPVAAATVTVVATGFKPIAFGTPTQRRPVQVTSLGRITRFGTPWTPTYRAGAVEGWSAITFGNPVGLPYNPAVLDRYVRPIQFRAIRFGTPTYAGSFTGAVTGHACTSFGTPAAIERARCDVTGLDAHAQFGTPAGRQIQRLTGFRATAFGTPIAARRQQVTGLASRTRFGTPTYTRSGAHHVYGWRGIRFGHPKTFTGSACRVLGFSSTQFGMPSATSAHRVTGLASGTRFGTPQAMRNPRC